jgi:hypothetical protein
MVPTFLTDNNHVRSYIMVVAKGQRKTMMYAFAVVLAVVILLAPIARDIYHWCNQKYHERQLMKQWEKEAERRFYRDRWSQPYTDSEGHTLH